AHRGPCQEGEGRERERHRQGPRDLPCHSLPPPRRGRLRQAYTGASRTRKGGHGPPPVSAWTSLEAFATAAQLWSAVVASRVRPATATHPWSSSCMARMVRTFARTSLLGLCSRSEPAALLPRARRFCR